MSVQTLDEMIKEDDAKREAADKAQADAELKAWWALPIAERERICAERDAKWDAIYAAMHYVSDADDTDTDDEGDDDEDVEDTGD